jgi:hypothetical protein
MGYFNLRVHVFIYEKKGFCYFFLPFTSVGFLLPITGPTRQLEFGTLIKLFCPSKLLLYFPLLYSMGLHFGRISVTNSIFSHVNCAL